MKTREMRIQTRREENVRYAQERQSGSLPSLEHPQHPYLPMNQSGCSCPHLLDLYVNDYVDFETGGSEKKNRHSREILHTQTCICL